MKQIHLFWLSKESSKGNDICFITKSRRPIERYDNGIMNILLILKWVSFHLSEHCADLFFQIFWRFISPHTNLIANYCYTNKAILLNTIITITKLLFFQKLEQLFIYSDEELFMLTTTFTFSFQLVFVLSMELFRNRISIVRVLFWINDL